MFQGHLQTARSWELRPPLRYGIALTAHVRRQALSMLTARCTERLTAAAYTATKRRSRLRSRAEVVNPTRATGLIPCALTASMYTNYVTASDSGDATFTLLRW